MNLLRGGLVVLSGEGTVELGSSRLHLPAALLAKRSKLAARAGEEVVVGIRPEALRPSADERPGIEGRVALVESLGSDLLVHVEVDAPAVVAVNGGDANGAMPNLARVTARLEPSVRVSAGDPIRLAVDPERLHFFDPRTERALG
jgi:multiple sugar transport system ATP-binding protein